MAPGKPSAVLGIDTSGEVVALALAVSGHAPRERAIPPDSGGRPRHAVELLAGVEELLAAGPGWEGVGLLAVGVGPGSFTGLRIGVATARGLAQARRLPIAAIGSLEALDRGLAELPQASDRARLTAFDARRGEAYASLRGPRGEASEPFLASGEELAARIAGLAEPVLAAGSGSLRFRAELEAAGAEVLADDAAEHRVAARHVCALASGARAASPEAIEPIYLRRPDAELWRERDGAIPAAG